MFKKIIAVAASVTMLFSGIAFSPAKKVNAAVHSSQGSETWKLVWNDEFNQTVGGAPDQSVWSYDIGVGNGGWGNAERQYYTNSTNNVYIADVSGDSSSSDGRALAIKAIKSGDSITSGRLKSLNKQYLRYGRIEAKIRTENGMQSGVWPAFWMMGNDIESGAPWPYCGEIDIMEHRNAEQNVIGTLHYNSGKGTSAGYAHQYIGSEINGQYGYIGDMNQWHKYAVEWYEDVIKFFVDDTCFETLNISSDEMEEFQKDHFILLNLAIGSTNSPFTLGQTISDSFTDATMYVDYVRVYQGTDSSFRRAKSTEGVTNPELTTMGDGMTVCSNQKTYLGDWGYYIWDGTYAKYLGGESLDGFQMKIVDNKKQNWGTQVFTKEIAVTSGKTYNVSVDVDSNVVTPAILMKDEISETEFVNQGLIAGKNTLKGTFTANSDKMQFMFNLQNVDSGTTLNFSNVTVTEVSDGQDTSKETSTSKENQTTGGNVTPSNLTEIKGGAENTYYYDKDSMENVKEVVNIQQAGYATEPGIYVNVPAGISDVKVNGVALDATAIQGAGTWIYLSKLTKRTNNVEITYAGGVAKITIANMSMSEGSDVTTTSQQTTTSKQEVTTTKQQTTTSKQEVTTTKQQTTTNKQEVTTTIKQPNTSTTLGTTKAPETVKQTTTANKVDSTKVKLGKTKIAKASKKKNVKKIKLTLKKIKGAKGYQVKVSTSKKFKKKTTVTKTIKKLTNTVNIKKLKVVKKYYIKARAFSKTKGTISYGKWSKVKVVKIN
ncbi:glycoside hydrolase family 16 protein [Eubacterium sp. Marseille-QA0814]|uniref:glycoside hydrolase family 16 protein n=1 Tax=Eubacterium sp. Marseille-QA0814 TaxID=3378778 RepID=UPI003D0D4CC6